jgi:transcriptional regulator with XRE-family HTH domain
MTRLKELRIEHKMSLSQVSAASGVPVRTLARYEAGDTSPGAAILTRMADLYGCSVDQLLGRASMDVPHAV